MILEHTINKGSQFLKKQNISSHELDAEIILSDIMGVTREFLIINNHIIKCETNQRDYNNQCMHGSRCNG